MVNWSERVKAMHERVKDDPVYLTAGILIGVADEIYRRKHERGLKGKDLVRLLNERVMDGLSEMTSKKRKARLYKKACWTKKRLKKVLSGDIDTTVLELASLAQAVGLRLGRLSLLDYQIGEPYSDVGQGYSVRSLSEGGGGADLQRRDDSGGSGEVDAAGS